MAKKITVTMAELKKIVQEMANQGKAIEAKKPKEKLDKSSKSHLKLLEMIMESSKPVQADRLAKMAMEAGYSRGQGAAAAFRGRHPSLKYRVEKYIEVTQRGKQLVLMYKAKEKPVKASDGQRANGEELVTDAQQGK